MQTVRDWVLRFNGGGAEGLIDPKPPGKMDSSVSPTHGDQEGSAYNGHFGCNCYHTLFLFNHSNVWF